MPLQYPENVRYAQSPLSGLEVLSCNDSREFSPHLHEGYVLWLNSAAGEHFSVRQSTAVLEPGSFSIIEPGIIHANRAFNPDKRHLRSFYFTPGFIEAVAAELFERTPRVCLDTRVVSDNSLWQRLTELHCAHFASTDRFDLEVVTYQLFGDIISSPASNAAHSTAAREEKRVDLVSDYFRENIQSQFTLSEVAQLASCSSFHLIRLFRHITGIAPHAYLRQLRLENARVLLSQGKSIADAAFQSGFSDQSHLTRLFKTRYGVTPGVYRKSCMRDAGYK